MFKHKLNSLAKELTNNHPRVDFGGCGVVAAHVAKHLSQHVPIRIAIANDDWNEQDLNDIRKNINPLNKNEWKANDIDFAHVVVEFKEKGRWYAFDSSNGVVPHKEFWEDCCPWRRNKGEMTVEEATAMANTNDWNPMFDRDEIPVIRGRITRFINRVVS